MARKLVVFVPAESLDAVRDAVFAAGAGRIGKYGRCGWATEGTGTFLADEGANPAIGTIGEEQYVAEFRFEVGYADELHDAVIGALLAAHPYEEPAYDVYQVL